MPNEVKVPERIWIDNETPFVVLSTLGTKLNETDIEFIRASVAAEQVAAMKRAMIAVVQTSWRTQAQSDFVAGLVKAMGQVGIPK